MICSLVKQALAEKKIAGIVSLEKMDNIEKFDIPKAKDDSDSLVFIQFSRSGHIAVVGAGKDYKKNPLYYCPKGTPLILKTMRDRNIGNDYTDFQFDVEEVIMIAIKDLDSKGNNKASELFKSRNAVEQYIGEYLVKKGIPILNYYQHWNFNNSVLA